jgi:hypothetical protein
MLDSYCLLEFSANHYLTHFKNISEAVKASRRAAGYFLTLASTGLCDWRSEHIRVQQKDSSIFYSNPVGFELLVLNTIYSTVDGSIGMSLTYRELFAPVENFIRSLILYYNSYPWNDSEAQEIFGHVGEIYPICKYSCIRGILTHNNIWSLR